MTNVGSDQLVYLIGLKQVEIDMLRSENEQLRQRVTALEVANDVKGLRVDAKEKVADEEGD